MKKLLTALLCLALLAQLTVPVWAEDDLVIEIEQEAPSQDELEDISEDLTVDMDEADASFIEQMDDGRVKALFTDKQRAATPGQSVVFYYDDYAVGGGYID